MNIRSKALYQYLHQANVINGSDVEIARAKQEYRKQYKRQWKQRKHAATEIRFTVPPKQFTDFKRTAERHALKHTTYAKQIILKSIGQPTMPDKILLEVLQLVSIATIGAVKQSISLPEITDLLTEAETLLLQFIQSSHVNEP